MALRVNWHSSPRIITITEPTTNITIQELSDQIKDLEDEPASLQYPILILTYGKQSLGSGVFVGITAVLQNAQIAFEARSGPATIQCTVSDGNLVAEDDNGTSINPIYPTTFTQVTVQQSTSPSIITPASDDHIIRLLNSLRGRLRTSNSYYYWNPTLGNNSNSGTSPSQAVLTFAQAQNLAEAGVGDTIFCVASNSSGTTIVTETINITKANLKVIGPGYPFQLTPTTTTSPTVTISAPNIEVSGLYINTASTGNENAIEVASNGAFIKDCWINNVRGNGINISSAARTQIESCVIESCGTSGTGNGINMSNNTSNTIINHCLIFDNPNGVVLSGTGLTDNIIEANLIYKNSGYGVDIGNSVESTMVRGANTIVNNTTNTRDLGTQTFIETQAGGASASDIADAVWDEVISGHLSPNTTGKTLKDVKTKATLASIK
jgi:hypothetical protein